MTLDTTEPENYCISYPTPYQQGKDSLKIGKEKGPLILGLFTSGQSSTLSRMKSSIAVLHRKSQTLAPGGCLLCFSRLEVNLHFLA